MDQPFSIPPGARAIGDAEEAVLLAEMEQVIDKSHLFKSLDDTGRKRVISSGYVCTFHPGDVLMQQGEPGDVMYLILEGEVTVEATTPTGTLSLAELSRGACIGEVSVLTGGERTATLKAKSDVDCVAFKRERIEKILESYPKVREVLEAIIEGRAKDTVEKIVGS